MYGMIEEGTGVSIGQLRRGVAEQCVLALLSRSEGYGFDLARTLVDAGLMAGEGTIYPLLARLREAGLVETFWRESSEGPPRRYYRLTMAGRRSCENFKPLWAQFRDAVDAVLEQKGPARHAAP